MKRILTAVVFVPIFVLIVGLPVWMYFLLLGAAVVLAVREIENLAGRRGVRLHAALAGLFALAILYSFMDARLQPIGVVAAALILVPVLVLLRPGRLDRSLASLGITLLTSVILGVLVGFQMQIRVLDEVMGQHLVFYFFLVVWTGDTAAFYVGSLLGRHPLMPAVSPNKSIEGSLAGAIASMAAGAGGAGWLLTGIAPLQGAAIGFLLNLFGQCGDLLESSLKRISGVKDSAAILPGHGGILDRMDSLVLAGPVFCLCCRWLFV